MKFKNITVHNFMRYKGDCEIDFSCDEKYNVTVVLGDNTHGKTTLAQAFRWCLYGEIIPTRYTNKPAEIRLLNNEVIAGMTVNDHEDVFVKISVLDKDDEYIFVRKISYRKKNSNPDDFSIAQSGETRLTMQKVSSGVPGDVIDKKEQVQTQINNMFPNSLSNYLFFDGERWNDARNKKEDIRNSINTITGLNASISMARHLKDLSSNSAIRILEKQINTSDQASAALKREIEDLEADITRLDKDNEDLKAKVDSYDSIIKTTEEQLNANRKSETAQEKLKTLRNEIANLERTRDSIYRDIVETFSGSAKYFGGGMLDELSELLSGMKLEGKYIPGVDVTTVDYLIHDLKKCLCGACLDESSSDFNSEALVELKELREVIPPFVLGGIAGTLKEDIAEWKEETSSFVENFENKVSNYASINSQIDEKTDDYDKLERRTDKSLNLEEIRRQYNNAISSKNVAQGTLDKNLGRIEEKRKQITNKQAQIDANSTKSGENRTIYLAIEYAKRIYDMAKVRIDKRANNVKSELNDIIARNYEEMFNAKEKYAKLGDDYKIHVYYRDLNGHKGDYEEEVLSNGEVMAINYVFIVSILELARREQQINIETKGDHDTTLQLPLVLDAPFSNLSNENTSLIANNLPKFAEQIIVFMLDKDWEASGLSEYTGNAYCYRISKQKDANYASIERAEVI